MKRRGRKKRSRRRLMRAAARRVQAQRTLGGLPLGVVIEQGLLAPNTGREPGPRVRASTAERAHIDALHADETDRLPALTSYRFDGTRPERTRRKEV